MKNKSTNKNKKGGGEEKPATTENSSDGTSNNSLVPANLGESSKEFFKQLLNLNKIILVFLLIGLLTFIRTIYLIIMQNVSDKKEADKVDMDEEESQKYYDLFNLKVIPHDKLGDYMTTGGVFHFIINIDQNNILWDDNHHHWKYLMVVSTDFDQEEKYTCWSQVVTQLPSIWIHPYRNDLLIVLSDVNQTTNSDDSEMKEANRWLIEDFPLGRFFYLALSISYQQLDVFIDGNLRLSVPLKFNPPVPNENVKGYLRDKPVEGIETTFQFTEGLADIKTIKSIAKTVQNKN